MANEQIGIQLACVVAAALVIFGLKFLGSPATARRGNQISAVGMLLAVVAALMDQGIVDYSYILAGFIIGGARQRELSPQVAARFFEPAAVQRDPGELQVRLRPGRVQTQHQFKRHLRRVQVM